MSSGAPDHYKTALLAGMSDGDPILAYITSDGRFVMRMEDWPDVWGEAARVGIAELIAALTPAKRWDRRGNIITIEDFTAGLSRVEQSTSGTGAAVEISSAQALYGGYSCKLTGGSNESRTATITFYTGLTVATKFGLECSVAPVVYLTYLTLRMVVYDSERAHDARVRYDNILKRWELFNSSAGWTVLDFSYKLQPGYNLFFPVKFVIDVSTRKYVRMIGGPEEQDLSDYGYYSWTGDYSPYATCEITAQSEEGKNGIAYVDNVIITQNEPE